MPDQTLDEFQAAVNKVIDLETGGDAKGGYTNDPRDPGGETKWGISKRAHPNLDIANLSRTDAEAVYKAEYWTPLLAYPASPALRALAFSCAVNQGLHRAEDWLAASIGQLDWFMAERAMAYVANPNFGIYGKGWLRRLFKELV